MGIREVLAVALILTPMLVVGWLVYLKSRWNARVASLLSALGLSGSLKAFNQGAGLLNTGLWGAKGNLSVAIDRSGRCCYRVAAPGMTIGLHTVEREVDFYIERSTPGSPPDLVTGDRNFDAAASIRGNRHDLACALTEKARHAIQQCFELPGEFSVEVGVATYVQPELPTLESARATVALLQNAARAMHMGMAKERLAHIVQNDPEWQMRRLALRSMARALPDTARLSEEVERARSDESAEVRLLAATLSPDGADQLCREAVDTWN
ncbi:MAG: hypothetical protein KC561_20260, partial [Myxococcales bacterium]|nr:hypothetical protein [Myxococcales bacterium]